MEVESQLWWHDAWDMLATFNLELQFESYLWWNTNERVSCYKYPGTWLDAVHADIDQTKEIGYCKEITSTA